MYKIRVCVKRKRGAAFVWVLGEKPEKKKVDIMDKSIRDNRQM